MNTASIFFCPVNGFLTCVACMVLALGGVGAQCAGLGGRRKLLTTCLEHELPFIFTDSYCIRTIPDSVLKIEMVDFLNISAENYFYKQVATGTTYTLRLI